MDIRRSSLILFPGLLIIALLAMPSITLGRSCTLPDGKVVETERMGALTEISRANSSDRWLALMKQGERLSSIAGLASLKWFYFQPDSDQTRFERQTRSAEAAVCLFGAARAKFTDAENLDSKRVHTSREAFKNHVSEEEAFVGFMGTALKFRNTADIEIRRQNAANQALKEARKGIAARNSFRSNGDLKRYEEVTHSVLTALRRLASDQTLCKSIKNCPIQLKESVTSLSEAVYEAGGSLPGGPTQASWKANKEAEAKRKADAAARSRDAEARRRQGQSLMQQSQLLLAVKTNRTPFVKILLSDPKRMGLPPQDPNFTHPDFENNRSPLMLAALNGNSEIVTLLIKAGADKSLKDSSGLTAAQICEASAKCGSEILKLLK